jgi:hypothetical protein
MDDCDSSKPRCGMCNYCKAQEAALESAAWRALMDWLKYESKMSPWQVKRILEKEAEARG